MDRLRGYLVAVAIVLSACAGDSGTEMDKPAKPVVWDCECEGIRADRFGIETREMYTELTCAAANPSDDDCACEATETRCEPDAGM